jgi:hypothetical protein
MSEGRRERKMTVLKTKAAKRGQMSSDSMSGALWALESV